MRSFGQVFAFKGKESKGDGVSVGVRGPVSIHPAFSVDPIDVDDIQITKSVNGTTGEKKSSDTMGMKHRVDKGVYVFYGSMNPQLAERTGSTPKWKFHKYLINRDATEVVAYTSLTSPDSRSLLKKIDQFLAQPQPQAQR